jgi:hypothetical protein
MAKKTWELIVTIVEIALNIAVLLKDKLSGGNHDSTRTSEKK